MQGKGILKAFALEGTAFRFKKHAEVCKSYEAGILVEEAYQKYLEGRHSYLIKHLTIMKNMSMNQCKKCEQRYHIRGNLPGQCVEALPSGTHDPQYDFTKDSENVINCEI